jgi:hypothetical protein
MLFINNTNIHIAKKLIKKSIINIDDDDKSIIKINLILYLYIIIVLV